MYAPQFLAEIDRLFAEGRTLTEVGQALGCHRKTVKKASAGRHDWEANRLLYGGRAITREQVEAVQELVAEGASVAEACAETGLKSGSIHRSAKRFGISFDRPAGVVCKPSIITGPVFKGTVPAWVVAADLATDYRDWARDFGPTRATLECQRLVAEASRACL